MLDSGAESLSTCSYRSFDSTVVGVDDVVSHRGSAETSANRERIIQGQQEGALTEYGQKQAKRLAKRLQVERVDFVYTSDLKRARQTTKKIAKRHSDAIVIRDRRLREKARITVCISGCLIWSQGAGIFEGCPVGSCSAAARAAGISEHEFRPEGGESWNDVEERAADFWRFLLSKHAPPLENTLPVTDAALHNDTLAGSKLPHIIIVTHSGFIQSLLSYLSKHANLAQVDLNKGVLHASITTLYVHPAATLRLLRSSDVAHLKGLGRNIRSPTRESALKAKGKPMKRTLGSSPSHGDVALRRRASATEERPDDRPIPAAALSTSPPALSLTVPSSPPSLARLLASSPPPARAHTASVPPRSPPEVLL